MNELKSALRRAWPSLWSAVFSALVICLGDRALPALLGDGEAILPGVASVFVTINAGGSFSFLSGSPALATALGAIALIVLAAFMPWKGLSPLCRAALGAAFSGGLCNFLSRLRFGFVRDWIHLDFMRFPVFNLADVFVCAGALVFVLGLLMDQKNGNA